jgi:hypothetical protein
VPGHEFAGVVAATGRDSYRTAGINFNAGLAERKVKAVKILIDPQAEEARPYRR